MLYDSREMSATYVLLPIKWIYVRVCRCRWGVQTDISFVCWQIIHSGPSEELSEVEEELMGKKTEEEAE